MQSNPNRIKSHACEVSRLIGFCIRKPKSKTLRTHRTGK
jgi:hypothetical protein